MEQQQQEGFPCKYCGSDTSQQIVKAALWGERGLIAIENIPARVCQGCSEQFYDEQTAEKIEKVITDPAVTAGRELRVPLFSLAEIELPKGEDAPPREVDH